MSRIDDVMTQLRSTPRRKALVAYLCMGDPSLAESIDLAVACAEAGADVLELGAPFSDPTADGPVIARASERALRAGGGLGPSIEAARAIRARSAVPLMLFGYYNPIFVRGEERTVRDARAAGVDGLLVVDLPVEEAATLRPLCKSHAMALVPLLSPTSSPARIAVTKAAVSQCAPGFLYYVSVAGVTGTAEAPLVEAGTRAAMLREAVGAPVVIGFGIDSPEKARLAGARVDGVVVGSAIVRRIAEGTDSASRKHDVVDLIRALRAACD
jgi:tryptophan synthase alpha chain